MVAGSVISVLAKIPWGQVVDAAPKVAEGATRLWNVVKNFRKPKPTTNEAPTGTSQTQPTEAEIVGARLSELEGTAQGLQEQMRSTAEIVKALADQNVLLVQRIELTRRRLVAFAVAGSASIVILAAAVIYLFAAR